MKKDRNTFFQEASYMNQTNFPPNMIANMPFTTNSYTSGGFYAGPPNMNNYNTQPQTNSNTTDYSDLEARLSKIERNINRLDARITKLENSTMYTDEVDTTNNIYMV